MTIHKSQGGNFEQVLYAHGKTHDPLTFRTSNIVFNLEEKVSELAL